MWQKILLCTWIRNRDSLHHAGHASLCRCPKCPSLVHKKRSTKKNLTSSKKYIYLSSRDVSHEAVWQTDPSSDPFTNRSWSFSGGTPHLTFAAFCLPWSILKEAIGSDEMPYQHAYAVSDTQSGSRHSHVSSITVSMLNMCKELLINFCAGVIYVFIYMSCGFSH